MLAERSLDNLVLCRGEHVAKDDIHRAEQAEIDRVILPQLGDVDIDLDEGGAGRQHGRPCIGREIIESRSGNEEDVDALGEIIGHRLMATEAEDAEMLAFARHDQ